jgi:putative aldouronate transport system substrate-binding protein
MRKLQKTTALLISVLMVLLLLAACSGGKGGSNTGGDNANKTSEASDSGGGSANSGSELDKYVPEAGKPYTIAWLASQINAPVPDDAVMKKYWEEKYNVKFDIWYIERSQWQEILNVRLAAGEFPDVIYAESPDALSNYYKQGLIMELPIELLERLVPKITADVAKVKEMEGVDPWITTRFDGKNYGIPRFNENGVYHFTSIWRKDWLDNVGIAKVPETLAEFEEAFYKFVNDDPDRDGKKDTYALSSGYAENPFASIYGAFGYLPEYWFVKNGEMIYGGIQPEMKEALATLSKWYADGLINPEFITGENRGGHWSISQDFIDNIIGYSNNGPFYVNAPPPIGGDRGGKMYRTFAAAHENDGAEMVIGRPPIGPNGDSGSVRWGLITGASIAFSKKLEEDPGKLAKILQIIQDIGTDYDNWLTAGKGIEGTHYKIDENGMIQDITPEGSVPEEFGLGQTFLAWEGLGMVKRMDPAYYEFADKVSTYTDKYTNALYTRLPSADMYLDELTKLQTEYYLEIITGRKPLDAFDEFVDRWRKSGGDQLIKEANEWYASVTQ